MKTVAFNGSPNKEGNTFHAITMVAAELEQEGIATEIIHVGNKAIRGCLACGQCRKKKNEQCVQSDEVNEWIQKMKNWVLKSLGKLSAEVRSCLLKKLKVLRDTRLKERKKMKTSPTLRSDVESSL